MTRGPLTYSPAAAGATDLGLVRQAAADAPDLVRCWLQPQPEFVRLPQAGIRGNGHMMMLEKNSLEIAAYLDRWTRANIERSARDARSNAETALPRIRVQALSGLPAAGNRR